MGRAPVNPGPAKALTLLPVAWCCCPSIKFYYGLCFEALATRIVLGASTISSTPHPRYLKEKLQVLDKIKALYGPRTQAYGETNYLKEKLPVLDRTKALYGPRTQVYGETNYLKEKLQVVDRTKALYGPRTQAYGETNYLKEKLQVLDRTKALYGP